MRVLVYLNYKENLLTSDFGGHQLSELVNFRRIGVRIAHVSQHFHRDWGQVAGPVPLAEITWFRIVACKAWASWMIFGFVMFAFSHG